MNATSPHTSDSDSTSTTDRRPSVSRVRGWWSTSRDALRTSLWPLPLAGVALAVAVGIGLPRVDAHVDHRVPSSATDYLFGGGADAARTVLSAIAGSLITVTSLTFSLTVVTLQLASSQFSPRLLRTFTRDRLVHVTLALFLATFTYALTVLRTVRTGGDTQRLFVPQFAVTLGFLLTLASVVTLVVFLAHLAREIRVETMLRNVHADARSAARRLLPERGDADTGTQAPSVPPHATVLHAASSGFLLRVDEPALLAAARDADAIVMLDRRPGDSLVAATPIGWAWLADPGSLLFDAQPALLDQVAAALSIGFERTGQQDVTYGLQQMVDVCVKALSPGVNDPTTAIHALSHISALLGQLASRRLGTRVLSDDNGQIRVVLARPDFADVLELAVGPARRYGSSDPTVLARITTLLAESAYLIREPDQRNAIRDHLGRIRRAADSQSFDQADQAHIEGLVRHVDIVLESTVPQPRFNS